MATSSPFAASQSLSKERVCHVSVLLTQIEPVESSRIFSWLVLFTRYFAAALAFAAVYSLQMLRLLCFWRYSWLLLSHDEDSEEFRRDSDCTETSFSSIDDEVEEVFDESHFNGKGKGLDQSTARRYSTIATKQIVASGNALRHFCLEFTMEDGSIYTMEKLFTGTHIYKGPSPRKERPYATVWSIPLDESTMRNNNSKKNVTLSDLQGIHKEEEKTEYFFFHDNCKRFAWLVLKRLVKPDILLDLEREHLCPGREQGGYSMKRHENAGHSSPALATTLSDRRTSSRYSVFRDFCQLQDNDFPFQSQISNAQQDDRRNKGEKML